MIRYTVIASAVLAGGLAHSSAQASIILWDPGSGGNGHGYEYVEAFLIGWDEASAIAQSMTFSGVNGHLATITDGSEQFFINNIPSLDPDFFPDSAIAMWLGGFQSNPGAAPDQTWSWVTGEEWSFTDWSAGEPNDASGPESHLAMFAPSRLNPPVMGWADFPGEAFSFFGLSGFLVEYDVPAPGAMALFGLALARSRRRRTVA